MEIPNSAPLHGAQLEDKTMPPPAPEGNLEVVIRTMESDFALLASSGAAYGIEGITVTIGEKKSAAAAGVAAGTATASDKFKYMVWGFIFVLGALILFFAGYYLVPMFLGSGGDNTAVTPPVTAGNNLVATSTTPHSTPQPTFLGHASYFSNPPVVLKLDLANANGGLPPDHATLIRTIEDGMKQYSNDNFFEIVPSGINTVQMSFADFANLMGVGNSDQSFFRDYFVQDYTIFIDKIKGVPYPGFIFKLKNGQSPILLQQKALSIEANPGDFRGFFLTDPGAPPGDFHDAQISGQPVRALSFGSSTTLYSGWFFNTYFIISTSDIGLKDAIVHF
ncbi:MAG: hypothetical protein V1489_02965 [Candidatus Liptonbacteria bacterium]